MKKKSVYIIFIIVLIVVSIIVYFGMKQNDNVSQDDSYTQEQLQIMKQQIKSDLPKMDGSTSTIPLEAGIIAKLYNISLKEAESQIMHSTTYGSFSKLIEGNVDLIFSTPLSQEQYAMANDRNVQLELVPIAKEAFVFVVNANNPVNSLTKQQLKDIYSGKITNWKEVGGNDAPIVAYQRNSTSGSQNYMIDFMGDTKLMEPITEFTPDSMVGLMDAIAIYDNAENAIGYSVYAYAADMYGNGNEIKFINVDGIEPTKSTMASGEYPLLNYNYAIFDKSKKENSTTRLLAKWLLTNEGQEAISSAGYIPVKQVDTNNQSIEFYTQKGTGKKKASDYQRADKYYEYSFEDGKYVIGGEHSNIYVEGLNNKNLQSEINSFIDNAINEIEQKANNTFKDGYNINVSGEKYSNYTIRPEIYITKACINGYLSVLVWLPYDYEVGSGERYAYFANTAVYDLYTGKKMEFSDLFYQGVDFVSYINDEIKRKILSSNVDMFIPVETKRDFVGIPKDLKNFTLDCIIFEKDNFIFANGNIFQYNIYFEDIYVINEPRDMKDIFVDNEKITEKYFMTTSGEVGKYEQILNSEDKIEYNIAVVDTNNEQVDNIINTYIKEYMKQNLTKEYIDKNYDIEEGILEYEDNYGFDTSFRMFGTDKLEYDIYAGSILFFSSTDIVSNAQFVFDLKTGNLISKIIDKKIRQ